MSSLRIFFLALLTVHMTRPRLCQAFTSFTPQKTQSPTALFASNGPLILAPPSSKKGAEQTSLVLLPGCQLKPEQYEKVARTIQKSSDQAVWIAVPKLPLDVANPLVLPGAVKGALKELQKQGYNGSKTFVGGHSLGCVFLPSVINGASGLSEEQVLGTINLGGFQARGIADDSILKEKPSLTMTGDMDGMVRTSRIAEDYHRNVLSVRNSVTDKETKLHHSVVLVEGMNHFGVVQGPAPFMKQLRDLPQEITQKESVKQVGKVVAAFMDVHQEASTNTVAERYLTERVDSTADYLQPLITALQLEGSRHVGCDPSDSALRNCSALRNGR